MQRFDILLPNELKRIFPLYIDIYLPGQQSERSRISPPTGGRMKGTYFESIFRQLFAVEHVGTSIDVGFIPFGKSPLRVGIE